MQLQELHMLVVLSEELNMRKASERLFVSQPALSQRLQTIEKRVGNQNLFRSQKGLTVTSAGEQIIQFAKEVTTEQDRVRERIDELEGGYTQACSCVVIGQHWLPKVLKRYVEKYPNAKVSLVTGWSSEMLKVCKTMSTSASFAGILIEGHKGILNDRSFIFSRFCHQGRG